MNEYLNDNMVNFILSMIINKKKIGLGWSHGFNFF